MRFLLPTTRASVALVRGASAFSSASNATATTAASAESAVELVKKEWAPEKKRTGLLAVKVGMMPVWDHFGYRHACTVLQVEECQVTQVKAADRHGFSALQLGVGLRKERNVPKPVLGHLAKAGVPAKRQLQEFRVSDDGLIPLGTCCYRYW
ncbi:hypothetical protein PINS_up011103 [Pythium insidiosum]|nr:hypothetical protein PINS_up011103 [Pythium insidiosum]